MTKEYIDGITVKALLEIGADDLGVWLWETDNEKDRLIFMSQVDAIFTMRHVLMKGVDKQNPFKEFEKEFRVGGHNDN